MNQIHFYRDKIASTPDLAILKAAIKEVIREADVEEESSDDEEDDIKYPEYMGGFFFKLKLQ